MAASALEKLIDAHTLSRAALTEQATTFARQSFEDFSGWNDHGAITDLTAVLARRVEGVQKQQAAVTNAYLARSLSQLVGRTIKPSRVIDVDDLRGPDVTHPGVYGRVTDYYRWRISEGDEDDTATTLAVQRAAIIAETDVDLAFRAMADRFMNDQAVTHYRRIIRPERSHGGSCGLCVAASDRLYNRGDLLPIHARCKCTVLPVTDEHDPGRDLNAAEFRLLYGDDDSGTDAASLKRQRFRVRRHGELGPVLARSGQQWRGPEQVRRDTNEVSSS